MRVHLIFDHDVNRRLVAQLLGDRYEIVDPGPDEVLPEAELYITDGRGLQQRREALRRRKAEESPVFLPILLVSVRQTTRPIDAGVWEIIDDMVRAPVDRAELGARIDTLVRARRLSQQLREKNQRLEELNQQKNQLLGMAAHDLRNPLGVISMYTEHLLGGLEEVLDDTQRKFLERIQSSSQFMVGMINDLLDLSAIESGKLNLTLVPMRVAALVRMNVELNQTLAEQKEIRIETEIDDDHPRVAVDPEKFDQVLNNLLSNAVKFSHPGTGVIVSVRTEGDEVVIRVRDEGQGIPEAERGRLFTPFGKASVQSTAGEKSTGLGLAIVKRIVEGHAGTIEVESEVGAGSTFIVRLPAADRG